MKDSGRNKQLAPKSGAISKAKVRLTLKMTNLRPQIRRKKIRRRLIKGDKKDETVALPQLGLILFRSQKAKRRSNATDLEKTSLSLFAINVIIRTITPKIILSQKTNCSLGNFDVCDCRLGGFIAYTQYQVSYPILSRQSLGLN